MAVDTGPPAADTAHMASGSLASANWVRTLVLWRRRLIDSVTPRSLNRIFQHGSRRFWQIARSASHRHTPLGHTGGRRCDRRAVGRRPLTDWRADTRCDHEGGDAGGVRRLRRWPLGGLDPALLVDVEHSVRFLYTDELIESNPMPLIGRPKVPKSLPKGLGAKTVSGLLEAIDADKRSQRRSDWPERDAALVLTAVLAGLRLTNCSTPTSVTSAPRPRVAGSSRSAARAIRIAESQWNRA